MNTGKWHRKVRARVRNDGEIQMHEAPRITVGIENGHRRLTGEPGSDPLDDRPPTDGLERLLSTHARRTAAGHDDGADPHLWS